MDDNCTFCDRSAFVDAELVVENEFCFYAISHDPGTDPDVLPGSGLIVPRAHRPTAFDLTPDEWTATRELLQSAKAELDEHWAPDGYSLIWNCYDAGGQYEHPLDAHLHVIPRFADEPYAGIGARWYIKQSANRRPDPMRPGSGLARGTAR
jgi:diadenosine tetraphosphate (Ap4A) HIT family hydrolase